VGSLALSLRNAVWPMLILLGTISVAATSRYIQFYLHLLSDQRTCTTPSCPEYHIVQGLLGSWQQYQAVVLALIWGLVGVLAIVFSVTLLILRRRVAENTLRFLGLVGFVVLLTFWIFSLALSGFNGLFSLTHLSERVPFPQPGLSTIISAASLLIFAVLLLTRRMRGGRGRGGERVPEPVTATHTE
jgi:amino acid transporter